MVSIKDVAALAGVSDRTVSRVVNGEALIRPKTKKKVQKAIETLGYVPNQAARLMRTSRSNVLGLITDVVSTTPFSTDIVRGIQDALDGTSYTLLTVNTSARYICTGSASRSPSANAVVGLVGVATTSTSENARS